MKPDCQLRVRILWYLEPSCLERKAGLMIRGQTGATEAPTRSSGRERWLSWVGLKKEAIVHLI